MRQTKSNSLNITQATYLVTVEIKHSLVDFDYGQLSNHLL